MDELADAQRGDQIEHRLRSLGSFAVPAAPPLNTLEGKSRRRRGRAIWVAAAAAVVVVVTGAAVLRDDGNESTEVRTAQSPDDESAWRTVAPSPLSPREASASVWTGKEVLIVGGSNASTCGPFSDCAAPSPASFLVDGAAYDPALDSWRAIADAPEPVYGADTVWVGDQALVHAGWPNRTALYAYDPSSDTWTIRSSPPATSLADGVVVGDLVVYAAGWHDGSDELHDWAYDLAADQWTPLPADPIGAATDRSYVFTRGKLVLFAQPSIGSDDSSFVRAAILDFSDGDLAAGQWRMLPRSEIGSGSAPWFGVDGYAVNPSQGTRGDPPHPAGGILDLRTEQWQPLPPRSPSQGANLPQVGEAGHYVVPGGQMQMFRPASGTWHHVPLSPIESAGEPLYANVGVWTGDEIFVWGGYRYDGRTSTLTADGAAYTPPEDDPAPTPPTSPPSGADTAPTTEPTSTTTPGVATGSLQPLGQGSISGSYEGIEEYRVNVDRCPDLDHWLDAEFTTTEGETWKFRSDYCGASENGVWLGEGTFSFTLPDSSTLTGILVSRAPLPTTGVPYSLTITGGSGSYAGASGFCDLTVEIEEVDFGTQRQSGSFACTIT